MHFGNVYCFTPASMRPSGITDGILERTIEQ